MPTDPSRTSPLTAPARVLTARLLALDTSTLSDALDANGLDGVVSGLTPLGPRVRVAGAVRTVQLGPADGSVAARHLGTRAIEAAGPGDIIVVSHRSRADAAGWGGLLSVAAKVAGVSGVIVDGSARDVDDYCDLGFPVFARSAVPTSARGRVIELTSGEPIEVGGVGVREGDWAVADASGVLFISPEHIDKVLETAERLAEKESRMARDIRSGAAVTEVLGRTYETMLSSSTS